MTGHVEHHARRTLAVATALVLLVAFTALLGGEGASDVETVGAEIPWTTTTTTTSTTTTSSTTTGSDRADTSSSGTPTAEGPTDSAGDTVAPSVPPPAPTESSPPTTHRAPEARAFELDGSPAPVSIEAQTGPGTYLLTATLVDGTGRAMLTIDGQRVGEYGVVRAQRQFTVPVHISGSETRIGVAPVDDGAVRVERLHLEPTTAGFTTRGPTILDPAGQPFVPVGVNRTGLNQSADPTNMTRADFEVMADWGVNTVRLKLGQHLWLRGFCDHAPGYVAAVDEAITAITELGMVAYLDLAWSTADDPCGEPGLKPMPDQHSVQFWREVASRYQENPLVAFGIFNEPFEVSREVWRNGGTITERSGLLRTRSWQGVGMQTLLDAVRSTGARNIVYVSGIDYSHDLRPARSHPLDGFGLVYGPHMYCDECMTLPDAVGRAVEPLIGDYPIAITEFGTTLGNSTFNERVISWAEERGVGWMAFMWADRQYGAFGLLESWDAYEPSPGGVPVRDALDRHR